MPAITKKMPLEMSRKKPYRYSSRSSSRINPSCSIFSEMRSAITEIIPCHSWSGSDRWALWADRTKRSWSGSHHGEAHVQRPFLLPSQWCSFRFSWLSPPRPEAYHKRKIFSRREAERQTNLDKLRKVHNLQIIKYFQLQQHKIQIYSAIYRSYHLEQMVIY